MHHKMGIRQRWAWSAAAALGVICACACGMNWVWVTVGGLLAAVSQYVLDRNLREPGLAQLFRLLGKPGTLLRWLSLGWFVFVLAWSANTADLAFPMVEGYPLLGLTVLALAAWGSWKGTAACARCAGVLLLFLLPLLGTVTAFAIPEVKLSYLLPRGSWRQIIPALGLFLLPMGVWYLPCRRRQTGGSGWYFLLPAAGGLLAAVTAGVLSPVLAQRMASPLYTVMKSISLFGVMERVEPLLSAAMTMGAFCLVSISACACGALLGKSWGGPAACAAAALLMGVVSGVGLPWLAAGGGIFGIAVPLLVVLITKSKK